MSTVDFRDAPYARPEDRPPQARSEQRLAEVGDRHVPLGHRWSLKLRHWLAPTHCEDCGSPRGLDGRFLCEVEDLGLALAGAFAAEAKSAEETLHR